MDFFVVCSGTCPVGDDDDPEGFGGGEDDVPETWGTSTLYKVPPRLDLC